MDYIGNYGFFSKKWPFFTVFRNFFYKLLYTFKHIQILLYYSRLKRCVPHGQADT